MISIENINDAPWNRDKWTGELISVDGTSVEDFTMEDVEVLLAYGETPDDWNGSSAGVAELKDGRLISWESSYGPTGCGFRKNAYGGTADILFSSTVQTAVRCISEQSRELLEWS